MSKLKDLKPHCSVLKRSEKTRQWRLTSWRRGLRRGSYTFAVLPNKAEEAERKVEILNKKVMERWNDLL
jgi:hypothetical protein